MKKTLLLICGIGLILVAILIVPSTCLVLFILPERYQSAARIQIAAPPEIKGAVAVRGVPYWVQTEVEAVSSKAVLNRVIERLKLNEIWSRKYKETGVLSQDVSFLILFSSLQVRPVPNTCLIEIRVVSEKPSEAAQIANEVARVYAEAALARAKASARPDTPAVAPVQILDPAEPSFRPIGAKGPKIALALLASALLGTPGGIGVFLAVRRPSTVPTR
jgi:capsular polysaccharide biosynthesis protein